MTGKGESRLLTLAKSSCFTTAVIVRIAIAAVAS